MLQRATQLHNNLTDAMKKQDEEIQKLVQSSDGLTPKQDEIADKEGLLIAAFNQGTISAQQFDAAIKQLQTELNGPDKGMEDFVKGLSSDLDTLVNKMTDFNAMLTEASKKGGESIFKQLEGDAADFIKQLEQLVFKLAIVNPLLNSLGLGGQGNDKQLPTLGIFGASQNKGGIGFTGATSAVSGDSGGILAAIKDLFGYGSTGTNETVGTGGILGTIANWFGFGTSGQTPGGTAAVAGAGAGLSSEAVSAVSQVAFPAFDDGLVASTAEIESFIASLAEADAALKAMAAQAGSSTGSSGAGGLGSLGSLGGGGGGGDDGGMGEGEGFAEGGDFTVPGNTGTDTKRVSFLASPGEKVNITPQMASRPSSSDAKDSRRGGININMPISGVHADTFRATQHQTTADLLRAIRAAQRY